MNDNIDDDGNVNYGIAENIGEHETNKKRGYVNRAKEIYRGNKRDRAKKDESIKQQKILDGVKEYQ